MPFVLPPSQRRIKQKQCDHAAPDIFRFDLRPEKYDRTASALRLLFIHLPPPRLLAQVLRLPPLGLRP